MSTPQWTPCCATVDKMVACGHRAAGPHPDPTKGYSEPLCAFHLRLEKQAWDANHFGGPT